MKTSILNKYYKYIVMIIWLVIWFVIAKIINQDLIFPSPISVFKALFILIGDKSFWLICLDSILRIVLGYILGIIIACILALLSYHNYYIYNFIYPFIRALRSTPVASFSILALLWVGKIRVPTLIVLLMVFPIVYESIISGYQAVDEDLIEMAKAYKLSYIKKLLYIYFPGIMPSFIAAASSALGLAFKAGIAAEVIALPNNSIGKELYYSKIYLETSNLFAWTMIVIVISYLIEKIIKFIIARGNIYDN